MSPRLPELIEPDRMAETGRVLKGTIAVDKLKRLAPLLFKEDGEKGGEVIVELVFGVDAAGQLNVTGSLETDIKLQCQRCMQALELHIAEKISLAIVYNSQQDNELPSQYEPLLLDEEELVSLPELIEDEILLALPSVPLHKPDECQLKESTTTSRSEPEQNQAIHDVEPERKSPFAVLEQLRKKD